MQSEIYNLSIRRLSSSQWATDRERWRLKEPPIERYVAVFLVGGEPPIESASFSFLAESHRKRPRHFVEESLRCQGFAVSPPREEKGKTKREKERRNETDRSSSQSDCATYPLSNVPSKPDLGDVLCLIVFFPFILIANLAK